VKLDLVQVLMVILVLAIIAFLVTATLYLWSLMT
jgi:hypothetical protein